MHVPRVSDAKWKQLAEIKGQLQSTSRGRGGIMVIPPIADLDAWDKEATEQQLKLVEDARADAVVPVEVQQLTDPADRTDAYKPNATAPSLGTTPHPTAQRTHYR